MNLSPLIETWWRLPEKVQNSQPCKVKQKSGIDKTFRQIYTLKPLFATFSFPLSKVFLFISYSVLNILVIMRYQYEAGGRFIEK
jgi:hypothetical protein